ncbi:oxygenase MpaB family protein [Nocardia neocaledoniensis]|uniref:oxygenase MpaB family protein n=1 Tax=Nocardia neocaledoniensis TaxID=236511 RepID=UPI002457D728|nr:oxygenase MpaB family protein [Nocardia neocaledoniensis]
MTTVPTRHPDRPHRVPAIVGGFAAMLGVRGPDAAQWRRLGESLLVGDEPMDRLVDWMVTTGSKQTRPLFDRALAHGIAAVPEAPEPLREFFTAVETVPGWVDPDTLVRGAKVLLSSGSDGMYFARDVAMIGGYQFSGFNKTLLRTGALEKGSNQRWAETMQWAMDVLSEDALAPLGRGYQSTIRVRLIHGFVRRHVAAMPDWQAEDWGLPINQTDMAATLVGSFIAPTVGGLGMGLLLGPADADAVAHLVRYVGWLLGVEEQWLPHSFRDGVRVLVHTLSALADPDESTRVLAVPMSRDPLSWNYDRLPAVRRRLAYAQHLSVTGTFLGSRTMRALGLPTVIVPWYPALRIPANMVRSATRLLPGGLDRAAQRGARENDRFMRTLVSSGPTVGGSSARLTHAA